MTLLGEHQHGEPVGQEAARQDDAARWAGLDNERGGLSRKARAVKEVAGEIEIATRTRPPDHTGTSGPRP